jgi:glutathione peroxidase
MSAPIQSIPVKTITGDDTTLADYAGDVLLVVNVASKCGLTPQYEGLEALYRTYRDRGLQVLGFPANDFREQEPGTDAEIADFCSSNYAVDFPLFSKIVVSGPDRHPLYSALIEAQPAAEGNPGSFRERLQGFGIAVNPEPEILWNFEKFLVSRDGQVIRRFAPTVAPQDPALVAAIESALEA